MTYYNINIIKLIYDFFLSNIIINYVIKNVEEKSTSRLTNKYYPRIYLIKKKLEQVYILDKFVRL